VPDGVSTAKGAIAPAVICMATPTTHPAGSLSSQAIVRIVADYNHATAAKDREPRERGGGGGGGGGVWGGGFFFFFLLESASALRNSRCRFLVRL